MIGRRKKVDKKLRSINQHKIGTAKKQKDIKHRRMNKHILEIEAENKKLKAENRRLKAPKKKKVTK